jgi:microcystin-dependent protein
VSGNGVCPPGAILDFGTPVPPPGWLLCDGSAVSRTAYANLFAAISTSWGAGDGSTTFNLPPLTDRFRRSIGPAAGGVGTLQEPANLTHTHAGTTGNNNVGHTHPVTGSTGAMSANASHGHSTNANAAGPEIYGTSVNEGWVVPQIAAASITPTNTDHVHAVNLTSGNQSANHTHPFTTNTGSADASEARPKSATVLTCIKT